MNALDMHKEFNWLLSTKNKRQIEVKYIEVNDIYSEGWIPDVIKVDHLADCDCGSDPLGGDGIDD